MFETVSAFAIVLLTAASFAQPPTLPCDSGPCLNGATCINGMVNDFTCQCADGYTGVTCDMLADPVTCIVNETRLELAGFSANPRPRTINTTNTRFISERRNRRVRVNLQFDLSDGSLGEFRPININLTLTDVGRFVIRRVSLDGSRVMNEYNNTGTDLDVQFYEEMPYLRRIVLLGDPATTSSFPALNIDFFSACVKTLTGGVLPDSVTNPCGDGNLTDFFYPFPGDNTMFIQCDNLGNAFVRPCAPNTVWDDALETCV